MNKVAANQYQQQHYSYYPFHQDNISENQKSYNLFRYAINKHLPRFYNIKK